jgi:DNA-binding transcriptional MerR regulator
MAANITAPEAAKRLGIGITTIKTWADKIGLGHKTASGVWLYSEEDLRVLEVVQTLRDEDRSFDTIIRRIGQDGVLTTAAPSSNTDSRRPAISTEDAERQPTASDDIDREHQIDLLPVVRELNETVQQVNSLALLLTNAGKENERLRGEVLMAERRLIEAETKGAEADRLRQELDESRQRLNAERDDAALQRAVADNLRSELMAERGKSWWRKLMGG